MNHYEFLIVGPAVGGDRCKINVPVDCRDVVERRREGGGLPKGGWTGETRPSDDESVALLDPYLLQLRVTRRDVETTCDGDEFQMKERIVSGSGSGKAWDSFEDETLAIKKVSDDGAKRSENAFGISFAFARPIVCKWLTGEAHEEKVDVGHPLVVIEVRDVTTDDFVEEWRETWRSD